MEYVGSVLLFLVLAVYSKLRMEFGCKRRTYIELRYKQWQLYGCSCFSILCSSIFNTSASWKPDRSLVIDFVSIEYCMERTEMNEKNVILDEPLKYEIHCKIRCFGLMIVQIGFQHSNAIQTLFINSKSVPSSAYDRPYTYLIAIKYSMWLLDTAIEWPITN